VPTIRTTLEIFTKVRHMQEKAGYRVGWHLNPDGTSVGPSRPTWAGPPSLGHCSRLEYFFNRGLGCFLPELSTPWLWEASTEHSI